MSSASSIRGQRIRASLDDVELEGDVHRRLEARSADLAVTLQRVAVPEVEIRAVVEDRQVHGRAFARIGGIHVAAEVAGPQPAERLVAGGRDRQPAQHRLERHLDSLRRRCRQLEDADVAGAIEAPLEAACGKRIVEHARSRIAGHGTDARRVHRRHRAVPVRAQLEDPDDERVTGRRAFDEERADFARPRTAGLFVVVAWFRERAGLDDGARFQPQDGIANGKCGDARGRLEHDRRRGGLLGENRQQEEAREHATRLTASLLASVPGLSAAEGVGRSAAAAGISMLPAAGSRSLESSAAVAARPIAVGRSTVPAP